jgi:chromosome segregation ATPase
MAVKKEVDIEALKQKRKMLSGRVAVCEGKIKNLVREMDAEKEKPSFKTSKDPRHLKFQEAARRKLEDLQRSIDDLQKERAALNADVKKLSLIIKGQA